MERAERTEAHGRRRTFSSPEIPDRRISLVQDAPLIQRTFFRRRKQNKKKTNKQTTSTVSDSKLRRFPIPGELIPGDHPNMIERGLFVVAVLTNCGKTT